MQLCLTSHKLVGKQISSVSWPTNSHNREPIVIEEPGVEGVLLIPVKSIKIKTKLEKTIPKHFLKATLTKPLKMVY